jgi:hypothetical protein
MRSEEAALLSEWTPANVEAYGAALRADGDPRGELIAIDLVIERERKRSIRDALEEEKQQLQTTWLGEIGEHVETKFGFIEAIRADQELILDAIDDIAPFVRTLDIWGDRDGIEAVIERFTAAPRPWLHTLQATAFSDGQHPILREEIGAKLIAATPRLHTVNVRGHVVIDDFPHPSVTHVIVDGWDALLALAGTCAIPNATSLDYAIHHATVIDRELPPEFVRIGIISPAGFPKLTRLDLSRNEPRKDPIRPNCLGGATKLYEVLPKFAILPQIEELRLPSIRTAAMAAQLQAARERMPNLLTMKVARTYGQRPTGYLRVALPPPVPWLAGDAIRSVDAVVIQIGTEWMRGDLDDAYEVCEQDYDEKMTPEQRAAWDALWALVHRVGENAQQIETLTRAELDAILDTIGNEDHFYWHDIAKKLAEHPDGPLSVRRINTFETPREKTVVKPRTHASSERIEEHERALQEHWDLERLAVYADDLQELGDIRGELIALDLKLMKSPSSDLDFEHDQLHEEIFGDDYDIKSHLGCSIVTIDLSFDEDKDLAGVPAEVMRYLGELELEGDVEQVEEQLAILLAERRPWLRTLRVETSGRLAGSDSSVEELAEKCPILETLALEMDERHAMFRELVHPRVTSLRIIGACALAELGGPWPAVTSLDFAYGTEAASHDANNPITSAKLPALRTLDLSRNERAYGYYDRYKRRQCRGEFFEMFRPTDKQMLAGIVELKLPSLRSADHVAAVQRVIADMPRLERIEIARSYPRGPAIALQHSSARIVVAPPSSWVPPEEFPQNACLHVEAANVPLGDASLAMEDYYEKFSEPGKRAWNAIWARVDQPQFEIAAQTVYDAMDALRVINKYSYAWTEQVTTSIHALATAEKTIRIRRGTG